MTTAPTATFQVQATPAVPQTTGASLPMIGRTLAHRNVSTTAIYARLNLDPVRESMQKAATAMFAAGGLKPTAEVTAAIERDIPKWAKVIKDAGIKPGN